MTTLLFVHGTGVRAEAYEAAYACIAKNITKCGLRWNLLPCYWGDLHGSQLHFDGRTIPHYDKKRRLTTTPPLDNELALWSLLYEDPFAELLLLAQMPDAEPDMPSTILTVTPGTLIDHRIDTLTPTGVLATALATLTISNQFTEARHMLVASAAYQDLLVKIPSAAGPYRAALARALVAQALLLRFQGDSLSLSLLDIQARDAAVMEIVDALGGTDRGLIGGAFQHLIAPLLTFYVRSHRGQLTDRLFPFPGDVLHYQAKGAAIRLFIADAITKTPEPVVILAHSLGSIATLETLIQQPSLRHHVSLLVTAGSQFSLLYELDALASLRYYQPLPFTPPLPWLNLYDENDLLSYLAEPVFPAQVKDKRIETQQPFPYAHSAYWSTRATWEVISAHLP